MRARARAHADRLADVDDLARRRCARRRRRGRRSGGRGRAAAGARRASRAGPSVRLRPRRAAGARGAASSSASRTVVACAHSRGNSAQKTRAQVSASASARWETSTSIPSDSASARSRRWRASGCSRRASATVHSCGGLRPAQPGALERLAQHAAVERRAVGHEHAPAQLRGELGQLRLGRRRLVDHRLRDPGEALDAARERRAHGRAASPSARAARRRRRAPRRPRSARRRRPPARSSRCRRRGTPWWRRADRDPSGPCSIRLAPDGTTAALQARARLPPDAGVQSRAHPVWKEAAHDDFSHPAGDRPDHRRARGLGGLPREPARSRGRRLRGGRARSRGRACRRRCASCTPPRRPTERADPQRTAPSTRTPRRPISH